MSYEHNVCAKYFLRTSGARSFEELKILIKKIRAVYLFCKVLNVYVNRLLQSVRTKPFFVSSLE